MVVSLRSKAFSLQGFLAVDVTINFIPHLGEFFPLSSDI